LNGGADYRGHPVSRGETVKMYSRCTSSPYRKHPVHRVSSTSSRPSISDESKSSSSVGGLTNGSEGSPIQTMIPNGRSRSTGGQPVVFADVGGDPIVLSEGSSPPRRVRGLGVVPTRAVTAGGPRRQSCPARWSHRRSKDRHDGFLRWVSRRTGGPSEEQAPRTYPSTLGPPGGTAGRERGRLGGAASPLAALVNNLHGNHS